MTFVIAVAAGGLGAVCRYVVSGLVQRWSGSDFPTGTVAVNLTGAFALGAALGTGSGSVAIASVGGFLAGFTTFSTWMVESLGLGLVPRPRTRAVVNLVGMLLAGLALAAAGYSITS